MAYITLEEAKDHIRLESDFADDDLYVTDLIDVAEASVLNEIGGRVPGEGTVTTVGTTALTGSGTKFLNFKAGDVIRVDGETSRTISAITSNTALSVTVAFSTSSAGLDYYFEPSPLVSGVLPEPIKHAIKIMIGHLYNMREPVIAGVSVVKVPYTLEYLLSPYKYWTVA